MMSGTAISSVLYPIDFAAQFRSSAKYLGIKNWDIASTLNLAYQMKSADALDILLLADNFYVFPGTPATPWRTCVEGDWEGAFITEDPRKIWREGNFVQKPILTSLISNEGLVQLTLFNETLRKSFNENIYELLALQLDIDARYVPDVMRHYFGSKNYVDETNLDKYFESSLTFFRSNEYLGVAHSDDLVYLFSSVDFPPFEPNSPESRMSEILVRNIVNFVARGEVKVWRTLRPCTPETSTPFCDRQEFLRYRKSNPDQVIVKINNYIDLEMVKLWDKIDNGVNSTPQKPTSFDEGLGGVVDDAKSFSSQPEVCAKAGCVRGKFVSGLIKPYEAFYGIPYAEPPVGMLRFENPVPFSGWPGYWDASYTRDVCLQRDVFKPDLPILGSEDCLYLNVYRPLTWKKGKNLPVLVFIHGGAFTSWSGDPTLFGPDYFMGNGEIILVTLNYRLGIFGYLCSGDSSVKGNFAFKDQQLALQWIKTNIEFFGGDANSITVSGQSPEGRMSDILVQTIVNFVARGEVKAGWSGYWDASYARDICLQIAIFDPSRPILGSEDCLYLNIYRPLNRKDSEALPVLVFIPGGGFQTWSADPSLIGPDYIMANGEVILVTMNYRLGILGFLCSEDGSVKGNFGLKDQQLAMQWFRSWFEQPQGLLRQRSH
uniref:Carboxylesterase type B domain-containing protein n=1 Tax=Phlebotomus papatasi TaxID=29031 RepID=A0A1B0DG11_PHLPP